MTQALEIAVTQVIDYAGLFPPAKLPMARAVDEYFRHLAGPESFLVNRFACPAAWLPKLKLTLDGYSSYDVFEVTVIGSPPLEENPVGGIEADRILIETFRQETGDLVEVTGYETKLQGDLNQLLKSAKAIGSVDLYIEVPLDASTQLLAEVERHNELTAKGRTGGTTPGSHPSAEVFAGFLGECVDLGLPFKLTAGLHHPFPVYDPSTGDTMHGFLNVILATSLALAHDISRYEIAKVLPFDRNHFDFTDDESVMIGDWELDLEDIEEARELFEGFGSCSVHDPVSDLQVAGLW